MTKLDDRAQMVLDYLEVHAELPLRKFDVEDALHLGHGTTMRKCWQRVGLLADSAGWCLTTANPADEYTIVLTHDPERVLDGHLFISQIRAGVERVERRTGDFIANAPTVPGTDAAFLSVVIRARNEVLRAQEQMETDLRHEMIARRKRERENGHNGAS